MQTLQYSAQTQVNVKFIFDTYFKLLIHYIMSSSKITGNYLKFIID